jgi:nuclear protein localization family protein 4
VDNVVFENASIVERFLDYWRQTGHQRIGFLFGRYEVHSDVPLGIKAIVVAIYEPLQENTADTIRLLPDPKAPAAESIAAQLGLQKVGWIFTDLVPLDRQKGTVKCVRGSESHFLSAQECIMAGTIQNLHPNPCRLSPTGFFGSKAVTVCVTGNSDNQIHMEGYQVSNQCMALVRDDCLVPTKDAPELGYVRETSKQQFVPDVFYKEKDNFGNEVTLMARPLPIEYLLVDVPASTPNEPKYTFNPLPHKSPFPIANRFLENQIQDWQRVHAYLNQFTDDAALEALTDFHLLIFLATCDSAAISSQDMDALLRAIRRQDRTLFSQWTQLCESWKQIKSLSGE